MKQDLDELLSPYTPYTSQTAFRKDLFIQSRQEDIKRFYEFYSKPIGRGAYGTVFRAKLKQPPYTDRVVKVINKRMIRNPQVLQNEVNILRRLDHPNIIKLYESFEDNLYLYLVTDLCEGGELFDRIDEEGSFSEQRARQFFLQVVKTIKYLHLQKICHRDIKAENFLFSRPNDDYILLIDFGMACTWQVNMRQELAKKGRNKLVGTSYYVAPEVIAKDYDQRCDIWSLGVLLHVIVSASPPFPGDDDQQILSNIKKVKYQQSSFAIIRRGYLNFKRRILVPVEKRLTLDQILEHPWLRDRVDKPLALKLDFTRLKRVTGFSKLKSVVRAFLCAQLPARQLQSLAALFKSIDTNSDGFLSVTEMQNALVKAGTVVDSKQLHALLKTMDLDKNGRINYNQFVGAMLSDQFCQKQDYLQSIFKYFDLDGNGKISQKQLQLSVEKMGYSIPDKYFKELIAEADTDQDQQISYEEFLNAMRKIQ